MTNCLRGACSAPPSPLAQLGQRVSFDGQRAPCLARKTVLASETICDKKHQHLSKVGEIPLPTYPPSNKVLHLRSLEDHDDRSCVLALSSDLACAAPVPPSHIPLSCINDGGGGGAARDNGNGIILRKNVTARHRGRREWKMTQCADAELPPE